MGEYSIESDTVAHRKLPPAYATDVRVTGGVVTATGSKLALQGDNAVVRAVKGWHTCGGLRRAYR